MFCEVTWTFRVYSMPRYGFQDIIRQGFFLSQICSFAIQWLPSWEGKRHLRMFKMMWWTYFWLGHDWGQMLTYLSQSTFVSRPMQSVSGRKFNLSSHGSDREVHQTSQSYFGNFRFLPNWCYLHLYCAYSICFFRGRYMTVMVQIWILFGPLKHTKDT